MYRKKKSGKHSQPSQVNTLQCHRTFLKFPWLLLFLEPPSCIMPKPPLLDSELECCAHRAPHPTYWAYPYQATLPLWPWVKCYTIELPAHPPKGKKMHPKNMRNGRQVDVTLPSLHPSMGYSEIHIILKDHLYKFSLPDGRTCLLSDPLCHFTAHRK